MTGGGAAGSRPRCGMPRHPALEPPQPKAAPGRAGAHAHRTVRPGDEPNRLFTLRTIDLDAADPGPEPGGGAGLERDESPSGRTAFVLRDVTDNRDLRPVREAFLAVLSHELRTPITTIYAGSSVLARRPGLSPAATRTLP